MQPVIAAGSGLDRALFAGQPWKLADDARALLHFADVALVKSGTTTLEAALLGTPFVVVYRMNSLSYQIARRLVRVPHIALANLVAGERLAPEFIQDDATPQKLASTLETLLDPAAPERVDMLEGFTRVRHLLGEQGAAVRVADIARRLLESRQASR